MNPLHDAHTTFGCMGPEGPCTSKNPLTRRQDIVGIVVVFRRDEITPSAIEVRLPIGLCEIDRPDGISFAADINEDFIECGHVDNDARVDLRLTVRAVALANTADPCNHKPCLRANFTILRMSWTLPGTRTATGP